VNFEAFCGNDKPVEGRGSRVEGRGSRVEGRGSRVEQEFAAKRCDPPACYATPAGQGGGWWRVTCNGLFDFL